MDIPPVGDSDSGRPEPPATNLEQANPMPSWPNFSIAQVRATIVARLEDLPKHSCALSELLEYLRRRFETDRRGISDKALDRQVQQALWVLRIEQVVEYGVQKHGKFVPPFVALKEIPPPDSQRGNGLRMTGSVSSDPESAPGLSLEDLKKAILEELKTRPRYSALVTGLSHSVIRRIERISPGCIEPDFDAKFSQALMALRIEHILIDEKWGNERCVRLVGVCQKNATRKERPRTSEVEPVTRNSASRDIDDLSLETKPSVPSGDIPDLPEETHWDDSRESKDDLSKEQEADPYTDDETKKLLSILTGDSDEPRSPKEEQEPAKQQSRETPSPDDLFVHLEKCLRALPDFEIDRSFDELQVRFNHRQQSFSASIVHSAVHGKLKVRVFLPFKKEAALDLLQLFGEDEFAGSPGIARYMGETRYMIQRTIGLHGCSPEQAGNVVRQLLSEALRVYDRVLRVLE